MSDADRHPLFQGDGLTAALLHEVKDQIEKRVDEGHDRLRITLTDLVAEMRIGFDRLHADRKEQEKRAQDHSERLRLLENARTWEAENAKTRKQDQRDRTMLVTTITSIVVSALVAMATKLLMQ